MLVNAAILTGAKLSQRGSYLKSLSDPCSRLQGSCITCRYTRRSTGRGGLSACMQSAGRLRRATTTAFQRVRAARMHSSVFQECTLSQRTTGNSAMPLSACMAHITRKQCPALQSSEPQNHYSCMHSGARLDHDRRRAAHRESWQKLFRMHVQNGQAVQDRNCSHILHSKACVSLSLCRGHRHSLPVLC